MELAAQVVLVVALLAAAVFTVVPVLPGALLVPAGVVVYGLMLDFEPFAWYFWVGQAVLVGAAFAVDNVAQALGVQRVGGSRAAMVGGAIGVFVGPFLLAPVMGPFALLFGPPIGAVGGTLLGELRHRRKTVVADAPASDLRQLGTVALISYIAGMGTKLVLLAIQIGWVVVVVDW